MVGYELKAGGGGGWRRSEAWGLAGQEGILVHEEPPEEMRQADQQVSSLD